MNIFLSDRKPKKEEKPSGPSVKFVKGKYTGSARPHQEYHMTPEPMYNPAFEHDFDESEFNVRM
jgi:hypothetical protein